MGTLSSSVIPYDNAFFEAQSGASYFAATEVLPLVFAIIKPNSVLDIGCGVGTWLAAAREQGASDVLGVDGSWVSLRMLRIPPEQFLAHDLKKPLDLERRFDLAISLEVAEHLPESAAETCVDNLVRHAPVILFSAAVPGQGGTSHLNEQWPEYWADKFQKRDYVLIDCIRDRIWNHRRVPVCYRQNAFFYVDRKFLTSSSSLRAEQCRIKPAPLAVVHPDLLDEVLSRPVSTRRLLREMPGALSRTVSGKTKNLVSKLLYRSASSPA
ncbi:MAG TPA: class I SAM-dependent methyltransferase [Bryobacteraceae bacterium]|nr:class I SAM-dependent methyltransferase [Bryobacteraceae bacterium]